MLYSKIDSIGAVQPESVLTTDQIMKRILIPGNFKFELLTGIKARRVCTASENSFSLAVDATRACLKHSRFQPKDIDAVVSCSITRYKDGYNQLYEPPLSFFIKEAIGASQAIHFDVSNACAGMLTGIYAADALIRKGTIRNCLVVSGEFISGLIESAIRTIRTPASKELASLTVGDAGAAVILEKTIDPGSAISFAGFTTFTQHNDLCTARPHRRFQGAAMKTKAKRIHEVSVSESLPIIRDALRSFGLNYSEIDYLIPHQTSRSAILTGARIYSDFLGGNPGDLVVNLSQNGNTASTSHFLALFDLLMNKKLKPDDRVMLLSFASGIVVGTVLIKPDGLVKKYGN